MFEVNEIKWITRLVEDTFYISSKTTLEYILYQDIEHYEIIVDFDLEIWLKKIEKYSDIEISKKDDLIQIEFKKEKFSLSIKKIKSREFIESIKTAEFNIESIGIKISDYDEESFSDFQYQGKTYYARWVDPYNQRKNIRGNLIEPNNIAYITDHGNLLYRLIHLMAKYNFDLSSNTIEYLRNKKDEITYKKADLSYSFFKILSYNRASKYIHLLYDLKALEEHYPLIRSMEKLDASVFMKGLKGLEALEDILSSPEYFSESIYRVLKQNLKKVFPCGLTRLQLLKFSVLFYNAHLCMNLRINSHERYEQGFVDFCNYFHLGDQACAYYSHVVQNNRYTFLEIKNELMHQSMDLEEQYYFFEEFHDHTLDVLLIQYIDLIGESKNELYLKRLETYMISYISRFVEVQSINSEITSLEINKRVPDAQMLLLLDEVKSKVFLGNLRYDRSTILNYINKAIES